MNENCIWHRECDCPPEDTIESLRADVERLTAELATANSFIDSLAASHEQTDTVCLELRAEVERLSAERDALASALSVHRHALSHCYAQATISDDGVMRRLVASVLNAPLPHHAERVRLERAVVEATRDYAAQGKQHPYVGSVFSGVESALAALDAHDRKEQGE